MADRTYKCGCGYKFDRDIHSAKNMLTIKDFVLTTISVPPEQREITLEEFRTSLEIRNDLNMSERLIKKMPSPQIGIEFTNTLKILKRYNIYVKYRRLSVQIWFLDADLVKSA